MAKLIERAKNNELNCKSGINQLLYSLAEHGLLKEPFRSWASGSETVEPTQFLEFEKYNEAIIDLCESLIMFNDEIKEDGKIL